MMAGVGMEKMTMTRGSGQGIGRLISKSGVSGVVLKMRKEFPENERGIFLGSCENVFSSSCPQLYRPQGSFSGMLF